MLCTKFPTIWSQALTAENFQCRTTDDMVELNLILHTDLFHLLQSAQNQIILFSITGTLILNSGLLYCCVIVLCYKYKRLNKDDCTSIQKESGKSRSQITTDLFTNLPAIEYEPISSNDDLNSNKKNLF